MLQDRSKEQQFLLQSRSS